MYKILPILFISFLLGQIPSLKEPSFIPGEEYKYDLFVDLIKVGPDLVKLGSATLSTKKIETIKHRSEEKLTQYKVKANVEIIKSDKPVDTISEISASYDLLILGTPEKDNWIKVLLGGGKDKFTERAACSVLRITLKD